METEYQTASNMIRAVRKLRLDVGAEVALQEIPRLLQLHPENDQAWLEAALCYRAGGKRAAARDSFEKIGETSQDPTLKGAAWLAGRALITPHGVDEGEVARYDAASTTNEIDPVIAEGLLAMYRHPDTFPEGQVFLAQLLEDIESYRDLSPQELEWLGDLYEEGPEAMDRWVAAAQLTPTASIYFKIGSACMSARKYADASDYFRLALDVDPAHEGAKVALPQASRAMISTVGGVMPTFCLSERCWGRFYLNPYVLLDGLLPSGADCSEVVVDEAVRTNLMARLRQELDRGGGTLPWLPGFVIEPDKAMKAVEELACSDHARFHRYVMMDRPLLEFLQQGAIRHFTLTDRSLAMLLRVARDQRFRDWLGGYFSAQLDAVRAAAVAGDHTRVLRGILLGRSWVGEHGPRSHRTKRALRSTIMRLNEIQHIPSITVCEIDSYFERVEATARALPAEFHWSVVEMSGVAARAAQRLLRHGNLEAAGHLSHKAFALTRNLVDTQRDVMEGLLEPLSLLIGDRERRRDEPVFKFHTFSIDRHGVRDGDVQFAPEDVAGLRWGCLTAGVQPEAEKYYRYVFRSTDGKVMKWLFTESDFADCHFMRGVLTEAALAHLVPRIGRRLISRLQSGKSVTVGPCTLTQEGVTFSITGFLRPRTILWPWDRVCAQMTGDLVVLSPLDGSGAPVVISTDADFNAVLIPWVWEEMRS